jgi:hypothetical protein
MGRGSKTEVAGEYGSRARGGASRTDGSLTQSTGPLVLGASHHKLVREAGQILRHQIRLAFWSAAKTRPVVHSKFEQRAQGRGASAVASYHRGGAAAPRNGSPTFFSSFPHNLSRSLPTSQSMSELLGATES